MVPLDVSHIRAALGIGYDAGGAWFKLDEEDVGFSTKEGWRLVILRQWSARPIVHGYARSTSSHVGIPHDPHDHLADFSGCKIDQPGRIVHSRPLPLASSLFTPDTYMCAEPDAAITALVLGAYCPPPS